MSTEAKVGGFVILSIALFVYTFISVANVQVRGERHTYKTYFRFAGGLEPGNIVRFAGLKAGVITAVRPWKDDPTRIEVVMEVDDDVPVNTDSVAQLASLSALGQNYLEITAGGKDAARLEDGGTVKSAETVTINDITKKLADVADTANVVMTNFNGEFAKMSDDIQKVLENVQGLTNETNQKNVQDLLANSNGMVADLRPKFEHITEQLNQTLTKVDKLTDDFRQVAARADTMVESANKTVDETREPIKRDLAELERTLTEARAMLENIQALVAVNQEDISQTIQNFRAASDNVQQLTDELRQHPWSLIRVKPKAEREVPVAQQR
jgi:phospholipid/cholesterol/gamma-HCH transport system substrate-binding protein